MPRKTIVSGAQGRRRGEIAAVLWQPARRMTAPRAFYVTLMATAACLPIAQDAAAARVCVARATVEASNIRIDNGGFKEIPNNNNAVILGTLYYFPNGNPTKVSNVDEFVRALEQNPEQNFDVNDDGTMTSPVASASPGSSVSGGTSGPVSLASNDISNAQVDDLIRQRRDLAQSDVAASGSTEAAQGVVEPLQQSASEPPAQPASGAAKKATKAKKKTSTPSAANLEPQSMAQPVAEPSLQPSRGAWAQIYGDYEKHRNMAPGQTDNPTRTQKTFGQIAGVDTAWYRQSSYGLETFQFGLLGGYNETKSDFSDTPNITNASAREKGGFVGAYGNYNAGRFGADALLKVDFYDLDKSAIVAHISEPVTCPDGEILVVDSVDDLQPQTVFTDKSGSVSETNYSIGGNIYYRYDLQDGFWIEPLVGARFTYTDYGSGAAALDLSDGKTLRVQGGARIGTSFMDVDRRYWTLSLLGLLYSDVYVDGYALDNSGFVTTASDVDEGKLRALAQVSAVVYMGDGLSLLGQADVRGGEDVWGIGGRLGARYEW